MRIGTHGSNSVVTVARHFSTEGVSPYDEVQWENRTASITSSSGEVIFKQENIRAPKTWSATATNIVASKYFYGKSGSELRETGVDQLVQRVVETITHSGIHQGYFDEEQAKVFSDELAYILLNQIAAFNSPVWFNVGCHLYEPRAQAGSWNWDQNNNQVLHTYTGYHHPQCSACFINSVEDSMEGIMDLARTEAMLFKFGSGTGTNFSSLRSSKETVSGGGVASGPLSFMRGLDSFAGVIKSGGKTRRAAKMAILNASHPDIKEFISCKVVEDRKAQTLMAAGYDGSSGPDSIAYSSVQYQNANNSVRAEDTFMQAAILDKPWELKAVKGGKVVETVSAKDLMMKIAEAAWECGDPGMQFDDVINEWHTCADTSRINASNPCSEYMFIDNSACNLASINLLKFLSEDGVFDVKGFRAAVRTLIIAQDILVDLSGYPTESIAKNSHDYRPLGLGYANLGALLMALCIPYDSEIGRQYAAAITSLMTAEAYCTSSYLASAMEPLGPANDREAELGDSGACPGWFKNRNSFLKVMYKHQQANKQILPAKSHNNPNGIDFIVEEAAEVWDAAITAGSMVGYRNSQVTVIAPTGTIGFLMDCDTTGIEPELSLIKYKKMVGGGVLKIVNETVPRALKLLGYNENEIKTLLDYISQHGSLEGASGVGFAPAGLPIFDTAFRPAKGERSIHYTGHIKMMAAVQPFLSGAISKTVNLPNEATAADIYNTYMEGWRLGLKSIAIYRDGSKSNQPMVTSKETKKESAVSATFQKNGKTFSHQAEFEAYIEQLVEDKMKSENLDGPPRAFRHKLPTTRSAINHRFSIAGHEGYLNVGLYKNGQPGEIFITMSKEGSTISGLMDSIALTLSMALQYGVPLEALVAKLSHTRFEPSGWTDNPDIKFAKSIMDYIARWLGKQFMEPQPEVVGESILIASGPPVEQQQAVLTGDLRDVVDVSDSPSCSVCGCLMVRNGACYKCLECGSSSGCS